MKALNLILSMGCAAALMANLAGCSSTKPTFDARAKSSGAGIVEGVQVKGDLDPAWLQNSEAFFTLGPGDTIEAEILGTPNSRAVLTVGPDGKVYFQLLPGTDVWGLTLSEAKDLLQKEMAKYVSSPQISVALRRVGSKSIWMLGRVNEPGVYQMAGPMTLLEAISLAGGISQTVYPDLKHSFVQRSGQYVPVDFQKLLGGDMSQNIYLQPDDLVYLPSSLYHEVFVLGAVSTPRSIPYNDELTLVKAISSSHGLVPGAYASHVAIVRGSMAEPKVAVVDYREIISGSETDIRLEPHDIVYVPYEPFKGLKAYANGILSTFVNTIAANEGANAVQKDGDSVGISISPVTPSPQSAEPQQAAP